MNRTTGLVALTLANLVMVLFSFASKGEPAFGDSGPGVLRGRALEIVDDHGRVRASLSVLPAGRSGKGEAYSETVLLRLITEKGRPSVKIAASEPASGLSFTGPSNTKNTYVILEAAGNASSLKLRNENGHEALVAP